MKTEYQFNDRQGQPVIINWAVLPNTQFVDEYLPGSNGDKVFVKCWTFDRHWNQLSGPYPALGVTAWKKD